MGVHAGSTNFAFDWAVAITWTISVSHEPQGGIPFAVKLHPSMTRICCILHQDGVFWFSTCSKLSSLQVAPVHTLCCAGVCCVRPAESEFALWLDANCCWGRQLVLFVTATC